MQEDVVSLLKDNSTGLGYSDISKSLNIPQSRVRDYVSKLHKKGDVIRSNNVPVIVRLA